MQNENFLRAQLIEHLNTRRKENPSYSLRAMARVFKTSPAQLSQVLSGKRPMSPKFIETASERLGFSSFGPKADFQIMHDDEFQLISEWYHFAILSLSKVSGSKADVRWIATQLGIDYFVAKMAFERLLKMELIKVEKGRYYQTSKPLHTTNDIPSEAIRQNHKQTLSLAAQKLVEISVEQREFSSMTMAVSSKKLPAAKKLIRKFKTEIYNLLESDKADNVYTLAIQLFPVSKIN